MFSFLKERKRACGSEEQTDPTLAMADAADNLVRMALESLTNSIATTKAAKATARKLHTVTKELTFDHIPMPDVNK